MQARTAPTSPAAKKNAEAVTKVWTEGQLQQPPKTPWGRLLVVVMLVTIMMNVVTVAAFGWYVHRYPNTWLTRFAPLTSTSTTTVIQPTKEPVTTIPAAVQQVVASAYGLARNQGQSGVYRANDTLGLAWPLSSSGWTVSVNGAWPTDVKSLVVVPAVGQTQAVTSIVNDPGSQFIFLKSTELTGQPVSLGSTDDLQIGQSVWVINGATAVARQIVQSVEPRWASSDRDERYLKLDAPLNLPVGSGVVTSDGHVVGLLGTEGQVWPLPTILPIVKRVIQQAAISRPTLGIQTLNQSSARISDQPTGSGFLIGADGTSPAVIAKSPADKAGLKSGDIITALDGQAPTPSLLRTLSKYQPGDKVTITYLRQQKEKTVSVTLGSTRS